MTDAPRWTWTYDDVRRCYDGERGFYPAACVAKDGRGRKPWGAYYAATPDGTPNSYHRTRREAIAACEAYYAE